MIQHLTDGKDCSYEWIDITDPQDDEMQLIADRYGLHEESVADCLQSGHLPKYEHFRNYTFIIIRVYLPRSTDVTTVQEMTSKIAIFITGKNIITIHRKSSACVQQVYRDFIGDEECTQPQHILTEIVKAALHTYDEPGQKLTQTIEYYEHQVFLNKRRAPLLKGMYFLKRRLDMIRRLLLLTYDIVDKLDPAMSSNADTRDLRDLYIKEKSLFDAMLENVNHLMNVYFNVASQRTNEIMKVLTVFSAFFLPLTFIVGVYGMNFQHMPELTWKYGYPLSLITMAIVVIVIYFWFRKRKWL